MRHGPYATLLIVTHAPAVQKGLALLVPALLFGFLVTAQWITFAGPAPRDVQIRYVDPLTAAVNDLQREQTELKGEIASLRDRLDDARQRGATQVGLSSDLGSRIADLRASAGLTAVSGEGLVATLEASRQQGGVAATERTPCFAPDLTDILNAAWRGGARAIAIGGERVVAFTSVYCVGTTIVVNGTIVASPYEVRMVGDRARLLARLDDPAELRDLKRRRDDRRVVFEIVSLPTLTVPGYSGPIASDTARPR